MNQVILDKYADLIVRTGASISEGHEVMISSPVICAELARAVARAAYKAGAKRVGVYYHDELFSRERYLNESIEQLTDFPDWLKQFRQYIVDRKAAYINIIAEDPDVMADVSPEVLAAVSKAGRQAFRHFYDATMGNVIRWSIVAYPNVKWAKKIFPDRSDADAVTGLWELIIKAMRLDADDPVAAWAEHNANVRRRAAFLNGANLKELVYKNSLGTDFKVGLPKGYCFLGAAEMSRDGIPFIANMPTEEIFSAPDRNKADGTLVASMPLSHNGNIIDKFSLTFKDGKIVDYKAEKGYDILKGIIETDEGSRYLGEVALVQFDSPIQNLKTLFYNTLFDENASCHFAIGRGYPTCLNGGNDMTQQQLKAAGINDSLEHVDFMVGTADLSITGIDHDGKQIPIFRNGNFVI